MPLNVLLISNLQSSSGIGRYTFSVYPALRELLGDGVQLYDCSSESLDHLFYQAYGKPFLFLAEETVRSLAMIYSMLKVPRAQNVYHFLNPLLSAFSRLVRPRIVTVHDIKMPFLTRRIVSDYVIATLFRSLRSADLVICVSEFTARLVRQRIGVDRDKIVVAPLGVDHRKFRPRSKTWARRMLGLPENGTILLHVGSDEERKNIEGLFGIFGRMKYEVPNSILLRVGVTAKTFPPKDLAHSVRLVRPSDESLPLFYNAADVFIFPSIMEGFGLPLLEAMASGTPVVTTSSSSIPEVVGDAALISDPGDYDSMADYATTVLTDIELAEKLAMKGINRSKEFTWTKCAQLTVEAYISVLNSRGNP